MKIRNVNSILYDTFFGHSSVNIIIFKAIIEIFTIFVCLYNIHCIIIDS